MFRILESVQVLPTGKDLTRWHLLDSNYQLVKPVERFLRFKQLSGSSIGTIKTYAEKLKFFWEYLELKKLDWQDFTVKHMAEFGHWYLTGGLLADETSFSNTLQDDPSVRTLRNKRTVNLALTALAQFYDFHISNQTVEDKCLRNYRMPHRASRGGLLAGYVKQSTVGMKRVRYKEPQKFPGCLTADQIRTLINACHTARDKLILWLLADTGMRKGELLGVHCSDVDWDKWIIRIIRRDNPNHAYAKGRERELSIASLREEIEFCEIVGKYFDEEYPKKVVQQLGHDMLFVVLHPGSPSYGQPLEPQNLNKLLKRLQQKTGIDLERIYPHLFRHTFATHNIREGRRKGKSSDEVAKVVQRQLGHKSISTTLEIYDHSFGEAELVEEMERVLKSNGTSTRKN